MESADLVLQKPNLAFVQCEDGWHRMDECGGKWRHRDIELESAPGSGQNSVCVTASQTGVLRAALRWKRRKEAGLPVKVLCDAWERGYGDLEWRGIVPERVMPWYFLTCDGKSACGCGVKTQPGAFCFWMLSEEDVTLCMDLRCGGTGVLLSGRRLGAACIVSVKDEEDSFRAAKDLCLKMRAGPGRPVFPVYGGNDWYYAYGGNTAAGILDEAGLISDFAADNKTRPYMVVDDGWQVTRDSGGDSRGPWDRGNSRFPDMPRLAGDIRRTGCRPGIWYRPLLTSLQDKSVRFLERKGFPPVLDPSDEDTLRFIAGDVARLAGWGYMLIKHDFSTYDIMGRWGFEMGASPTADGWSFSNTHKTTAEIITRLYRVIQEAAGSSLVLGCNTIGHLCAGIHDMSRTGDDTSGLNWERTRRMGVNTLAFRLPQHGAFYSADADCVGITDKIDWHVNRQWLSLLSRSGTPLFVSVEPQTCGAEQKAAIREAFAEASRPHSCRPVDWMETTCPSAWEIDGAEERFHWDPEDRIPPIEKI